MSRVIFEGDTLSRFGEKIPIPFIEQIRIYNNIMEIDLCLFLHVTDDNDQNQEIYDDLENLKLLAWSTEPGNRQQYNLSEFEVVSDRIYNDQAQRFAKLSFTQRLTDFNVEDYFSTRILYYCYISIRNDESGNRNASLENDALLNSEDFISSNTLYHYNVRKNYSSPLIYQEIRLDADGELIISPITIYEDSLGLPYQDTPLKNLSGNYYKTTDTFRSKLKEEIQNLIELYNSEDDSQLQSFLSSIAVENETENRSVDLLVNLQQILGSFPSRTSTSSLGNLYRDLETILFSANDEVSRGQQVVKKVVQNSKILRYDTPLVELQYNYQNTGDFFNGQYIYENYYMYREISAPEEVRNYFIFFYDYEKDIAENSNISHLLNVSTLNSFFGSSCLVNYYKMKETKVSRYSHGAKVLDFNVTYGENNSPDNLEYSRGLKFYLGGDSYRQTAGFSNPAVASNNAPYSSPYSYCVPRAFNYYQSPDYGPYKLVTFECQDFYDVSAISTTEKYEVYHTSTDLTMDFYNDLTSSFLQDFYSFEEYYDYASEFCAFNNLDNRFNDYFIDAIEESGLSENYKRAAFSLNLHTFIINGEVNFTREAFLNVVRNQIDELNPNNCTLETLNNFRDKMLQIRTFYTNGAFYLKAKRIIDSQIQEDLVYAEFTDFPDVYGGGGIWDIQEPIPGLEFDVTSRVSSDLPFIEESIRFSEINNQVIQDLANRASREIEINLAQSQRSYDRMMDFIRNRYLNIYGFSPNNYTNQYMANLANGAMSFLATQNMFQQNNLLRQNNILRQNINPMQFRGAQGQQVQQNNTRLLSNVSSFRVNRQAASARFVNNFRRGGY